MDIHVRALNGVCCCMNVSNAKVIFLPFLLCLHRLMKTILCIGASCVRIYSIFFLFCTFISFTQCNIETKWELKGEDSKKQTQKHCAKCLRMVVLNQKKFKQHTYTTPYPTNYNLLPVKLARTFLLSTKCKHCVIIIAYTFSRFISFRFVLFQSGRYNKMCCERYRLCTLDRTSFALFIEIRR